MCFESETDGTPFFRKRGGPAGFVVHPLAAGARGVSGRGLFPVRQEADRPDMAEGADPNDTVIREVEI